MWTGFIVITSPSCDDGTGVFECQEPVVVSAFVAEAAIERFDVGVLCRHARLDQLQLNAVPVSPLIQSSASELWALVGANCFGITAELSNAIQHSSHVLSRDRGIGHDLHGFLRAVVDDGQAL